MAGLVGRLLNVIRRREDRDVFSADDSNFEEETADVDGEDEDDGEDPRRGPKIALIASAATFVLLCGAGVTTYILGKDAAAPMVMAPLTDMEVEEDVAAGPLTPNVAATDRSTDRRPWLKEPAPDKPAAAPKTEPEKTEGQKAGPEKPVQTAAAPTPAPATPEVKPPTPPTPQPAPVVPTPAPEKQVAEAAPPVPETPPVPVETAPGAPDRFNAAAGANAAGRPRLVEPPAPPLDKKALAAPPPRFAGIADMRSKVVAYKTAVAAKPADKAGRSGKVAVVVQNLGLSQSATEAAIQKLPAAVVLSFSPYAPNLKKWIDMAKAGGHEVLVQLPMESKQYPAKDPGPLGLMTSLDPKKLDERIDMILRSAPGVMGVDDDMGSKFRESEGAMTAVFAKLKEKNLIYVQTEPGVRIGEAGVPSSVADVIIDERPFRAAVDARLDYVENLAKFQGSAVAVMGPKPVSFERLALWLDTLNAKGIILAPVSEVMIGRDQDQPAPKPAAQKPGQPAQKAAQPAQKPAPAKH